MATSPDTGESSSDTGAPTRVGGAWKPRLAVVAGAVLATVVVYVVGALLLDDGVRSPAMNDRAAADIPIGMVIGVSALVSLLGWGALAVLERFTARARLIWTIVALVVFLLSLAGPFSGTDVSTGNRIGLLAMHVTMAAILIPLLPRFHGRRPAAG